MAAFICILLVLVGIVWIDLRPKFREGNSALAGIGTVFSVLGFLLLMLALLGATWSGPMALVIRFLGR